MRLVRLAFLVLVALMWTRIAYVEITQDGIIRAFLRGLLNR